MNITITIPHDIQVELIGMANEAGWTLEDFIQQELIKLVEDTRAEEEWNRLNKF